MNNPLAQQYYGLLTQHLSVLEEGGRDMEEVYQALTELGIPQGNNANANASPPANTSKNNSNTTPSRISTIIPAAAPQEPTLPATLNLEHFFSMQQTWGAPGTLTHPYRDGTIDAQREEVGLGVREGTVVSFDVADLVTRANLALISKYGIDSVRAQEQNEYKSSVLYEMTRISKSEGGKLEMIDFAKFLTPVRGDADYLEWLSKKLQAHARADANDQMSSQAGMIGLAALFGNGPGAGLY